MDKQKSKQLKHNRRQKRVRAKISGAPECPRLTVFKSNCYVFAQIIDDTRGVTLASMHSKPLMKGSKEKNGEPVEFRLGKALAEVARKNDIKRVVFDRNGYQYHGRVKDVAEGARAGGLEF
jgi:large subunit ribosomal protein L18